MIAAMTNVKMYVLFNNYEFRYAYKLDDFRKINGAPLKQYFEDDNQLYFRDIINELDNSK